MAETAPLTKVMFKNRNITDFFKPFANPRPAKRPRLGDDDSELHTPPPEPVRLPTRTLSSPAAQTSADKRPFSQESATSSLSSLRSDGSTPYVPEKPPPRPEGCSLPPSPVIASSQRITRNGETMIRNSDHDSDSDISFDDIADLLGGKKSCSQSSPPTEPDLPQMPTGLRTRLITQSREGRSTRRRRDGEQSPRLDSVPKYKFSLQSLVAQTEKDNIAEAETAQVRKLIESLEKRRAALEATALEAKMDQNKSDGGISEQLLASVVEQQGDSSKIDKLMQAIERTEGPQRRKCWSFFDFVKPQIPQDHPRFPEEFLRHDLLSALVPCSIPDFQASCVSGFLGEVIAKTKIPDELLDWIIDASFTESNEDVRRAYISTLVNAGMQIANIINPSKVDMLLRQLGASDEALNVQYPVVPIWQTPTPDLKRCPNASWGPNLQIIMKLLTGVAPWVDANSRIRFLCILCRISLDASVLASRGVLDAVEESFEALVAAIPDQNFESVSPKVLTAISSQVEDAQFRLQLLRCMPATSPRLSLLRRRLALAFFFDDTTYLEKQPLKLVRVKKIVSHLREPQFAINRNTNYPQLAATVAMLDIGLGDGDPPDSGLDSDPERQFNEDVDKLAETIKSIVAKIVDSGGSHLARTEAKEVLDAFQARLVFGVRTKRRPRMTLFGNGHDMAGHMRASGDFMSKFLGKKKPVIEVDIE
ncbi:hypothetical protein MMC13_008105 [Lambiella insularis]|nr:hypothetical protein [Lambiella insularis]